MDFLTVSIYQQNVDGFAIINISISQLELVNNLLFQNMILISPLKGSLLTLCIVIIIISSLRDFRFSFAC